MPQTVTYADLERLLTNFGFTKRRAKVDNGFAVVFADKASGAEVFLRDYQTSEPVEPFKLAIVRSTLDTHGLLDRERFAKALDDICTAAKAG